MLLLTPPSCLFGSWRSPFPLRIPIFSPILSAIFKVVGIMTEEILTLKEVAAYLKLAEKTAYKLAAEGKLPGFKVGGSWRFKQVDIEKWIEEKKNKEANK